MKSQNASPSDSHPSDLDFNHLCLAAIWRLFVFIKTAYAAAPELASHKPPPSSLLHGQISTRSSLETP
jgi:hypothetical protein